MLERRFKSTQQPVASPNKGKAVLNKHDVKQDPSQVSGVTGKHNYTYEQVWSRTHNEIDKDQGRADGGFGRL